MVKKTKEEKHEAVLKREKTYYEKTGYKSNMQNPDVLEKIKQSNIEKYGVSWVTSTKDFLLKRHKTFNNNKTHYSSSKFQTHCSELLNGELNFKVKHVAKGYYKLNVAFLNEMIYLEIDGGGHFVFNYNKNKENERTSFLENLSWKMIRWISKKDNFLSDNLAKYIFSYCKNKILNENIKRIFIDFDEQTIILEDKIMQFGDDFYE